MSIDPQVLSVFYENASDGLAIINRARRIVLLNPAAAEMTGWKARDLSSITCSVLGCRDEHGRRTCEDQCLAMRCLESGQKIGPMFLRIQRADSTTTSVEATFLPMPVGAGGSCGLLMRDIAVLESLDGTVRHLNQELAQKNIILRGVSDQMSVAWRAAMLDIRTGAETLRARHGRELGPAGGTIVERMLQATQKLEGTFAQLKSRIQAAMITRRSDAD